MSLETEVMSQLKEAMKSKNEGALRALRAIKAEIIKAKVEPGANGELNAEGELKLLAKMVKERKESIDLYSQQNRADLATKEEEEVAVIETFLPAQLSEDEIKAAVAKIIAETGASSMKDMGKVMGMANKAMAGQADGKVISTIVKASLS